MFMATLCIEKGQLQDWLVSFQASYDTLGKNMRHLQSMNTHCGYFARLV